MVGGPTLGPNATAKILARLAVGNFGTRPVDASQTAPMEWPLPGYPGAYLEQVKLKSGNHPELGIAKWSDIPARVNTNLLVETEILAHLVLRTGSIEERSQLSSFPSYLSQSDWLIPSGNHEAWN